MRSITGTGHRNDHEKAQHPVGVKIGGINYNNLRYADDIAILAESEEQLQKIMDVVVKESKTAGLEINQKKSFIMVVSKKKETSHCNILIEGNTLKQIDTFCISGKYNLFQWQSTQGSSSKNWNCKDGLQINDKCIDSQKYQHCNKTPSFEVLCLEHPLVRLRDMDNWRIYKETPGSH